ncbi:MAG TPA: GNAT family N-acetyltransferase [Acidobacteriota bacterium]|nr:GNAT family N-acetyltransferase [Acidobacteriota bacterium]
MQSNSAFRTWERSEYVISDDPARMDVAVVHGYLTRSYWAAGVPLEIVRRSIEHSMVFGLFHGETQIGFARLVTDRTTFAYLADVFVLEAHRGKGLSKWLMEVIVGHPEVQGLRRWMLATRDAHGLYRQFGFTELPQPEVFMQRHHPDVYQQPAVEEESQSETNGRAN